MTQYFHPLFVLSLLISLPNTFSTPLNTHSSQRQTLLNRYFAQHIPRGGIPSAYLISNKDKRSDSSFDNRKHDNKLSIFPVSPWIVVLRNIIVEAAHSTFSYSNQIPMTALATGTISVLLVKNKLWRKTQTKYDSSIEHVPKMAPTNPYLRALAFWKRAGPIVAHYKFTQSWLKMRQYPFEKRDKIWTKIHNQYASKAFNIIIEFRGLFVKVGQVLSSRPDFMPQQYIDLFTSLQDTLPPKPFIEIKQIVEDSLKRTQGGLEFDDVFESFEETPLGTASIGQVHGAVLKTEFSVTPTVGESKSYIGGPIVAVKVMHPDAQNQFRNDFKLLQTLARIALPGWSTFLEELRRQLMTEFDYLDEAKSLNEVRTNMAQSIYSKYIKIPQPADYLCSRNVLVMEMLHGKKLSDHLLDELASALGGDVELAKEVIKSKHKELIKGTLQNGSADSRSTNQKSSEWKMALNDIKAIAGEDKLNTFYSQARMLVKLRSMRNQIKKSLNLLLDVHGHQIFINGVFNGDPHPGNILQLDDGRLGLIDYGQVKRLESKDRMALSKIILALDRKPGEENKNDFEIANAMRDFGFQSLRNKNDVIAFTAELYFDSNSNGSKLGYPNPQGYYQYLCYLDPMINVPQSAVMVARTSFLFRGMGALLQQDIRTAKFWSNHARKAIKSGHQ